jgi:arginine/lysine/ornithine decarboxylase
VHVELAQQTTIVLIVGLGESQAALLRVAGDIEETVARLRRDTPVVPLDGAFTADLPPMPVTPRTAFLSNGERIPVDLAVGRISCESIAAYPPGVPTLLPGELISVAVVEHLRGLAAGGARLHGASDPGFQTVTVMRQPESAAPPIV